MSSEWIETDWGSIATLEYGKGLRDYRSGGGAYPVYGTNGQVGHCESFLCPHSGIVVGRKGAYRGIHYSANPFYVIDTAYWLKPKIDLDLKWAYYELLRQDINSLDSGSAIPSTTRDAFYSLYVFLPPIEEQKAIAHILGTLDEKIELNRKTNETLEAMAKALFKSWFVDFDPVRAKAEGRSTGLPAEISDLFPDSFEDSELGEIPSGWIDGEIQDVSELNPETWGSRNQPLSVRYLDLSNVKHGKIDSVEEYRWEDAPSRARRILKTGDTVVGTVRPGNGSYCLIGEDGITGSTGFAVLRPKNKNDSAFVYLGSCSKENIDRLAHLADGGAYPAVRPELVAQTPIIIAPRDLLDCFSRSVSPLFAAAEERKQSSKLLCQARDALLPKLISGEIRIPVAEKMLEGVVL